MVKANPLSKINIPNWVLGILTLVLILRIPSFFEPYYYGDEMIYMSLGQGIRQGMTLYKDIHDNKPPLLYLTAAVSNNLFVFKAILCFWNIITVFFFYKLAGRIFALNKNSDPEKSEKKIKLATFLFAILTTIPLFEGNIVNAELFMIGFSIIAFFILLKDGLNSKNIFFSGLLFGMGSLFKIPAAFDLPIIVVYWFIANDFKDWFKVVKNSILLGIGFMTPILVSFGWFYLQGALPEYIRAAFLQNVGYLSSFRPGDVQKSFIVRNGPLLIRASIVFLSAAFLYISRRKLSKKFILLSIWVVFGLFAVTLSERPYPHYFIQIVAPVSMLLSIFFAEKSIEQSFTVIPLLLAFIVPFYYKFYYYQTGSYYQRFINFADGKINRGSYFQSFSDTTNRNYQIAEFLSQSSVKTDKVFMWDPDSAVVYALSRRLPGIKFVADYHINDYSNKLEVARDLEKNPPKFIILTSGHPYTELDELLKYRYLLISQIQNANIFSRVDSIRSN